MLQDSVHCIGFGGDPVGLYINWLGRGMASGADKCLGTRLISKEAWPIIYVLVPLLRAALSSMGFG